MNDLKTNVNQLKKWLIESQNDDDYEDGGRDCAPMAAWQEPM